MSYFIMLIPKVGSSLYLGEFNLISLLGSIYKMVANVFMDINVEVNKECGVARGPLWVQFRL